MALIGYTFYLYISNDRLRLISLRADGSWSVRIASYDIVDDYSLSHASFTRWWCWVILDHPEFNTIRYFSLRCGQSNNDDYRKLTVRINATRSLL